MNFISAGAKKTILRIALGFIMILLCAIFLLPFFWAISTSLRLPKDSFNLPPQFFPTSFCIQNYEMVFSTFPFLKFILNSLLVAVVLTISQVIITTMAGYAFARLHFAGKNICFFLILSGIMIPISSIIIPQFMVVKSLGIMDSQLAIILPYLINPMGIFLVKQFMQTIPSSYDEAAIIDGAGKFRIYWNVILPMSVPALAVVVVMTFVGSWNNFFGPLIYISSWDKMTLPLGLNVLSSSLGNGDISVILAGVVIAFIPPILIYIFGQKYLLQGTTLSGLKS